MKIAETLKCQRCGHTWTYRGKNKYIAYCPHCKTTVSINKNKVVHDENARTD